MRLGSVIVDLATERGGNCELSQPDQRVEEHGVTILGPTNLPAEVPYHASQMFAKNVTTFLAHLVSDGSLQLDLADEITHDTLLTSDGQVVQPRIRDLLGLEPLPSDAGDDEPEPESSKEESN
jgi:NAD(P) transhydrogenase subunit alpha